MFMENIGWYTLAINILCKINSERNSNWALQWRHDGRDSISNHQPHDCLLNRLFRRRSKKASKLRVTDLCEGNSLVSGEFPAQMASDAENVSISWRHHVTIHCAVPLTWVLFCVHQSMPKSMQEVYRCFHKTPDLSENSSGKEQCYLRTSYTNYIIHATRNSEIWFIEKTRYHYFGKCINIISYNYKRDRGHKYITGQHITCIWFILILSWHKCINSFINSLLFRINSVATLTPWDWLLHLSTLIIL